MHRFAFCYSSDSEFHEFQFHPEHLGGNKCSSFWFVKLEWSIYALINPLLKEKKVYEWASRIGADGDIKNNT